MLVVPANGIFQPFVLRKTERGLNLRADVGFADSPVEVSHENYRRNLFDEGAIPGLETGRLAGSTAGRRSLSLEVVLLAILIRLDARSPKTRSLSSGGLPAHPRD